MDHPRIRGEHVKNGTFSTGMAGSSPHTRGARGGGRRQAGSRGIIPAYAGSTWSSRLSQSLAADHPRIRGEHHHPIPAVSRMNGSSPHTRGARDRVLLRRLHERIIPAYAGSTRHVAATGRCPRDHPRIRGEHAPRRYCLGLLPGSSPHTRGARVHALPTTRIVRIIPAYAGSTRSCPPHDADCPDHPRIRGEHSGLPLAEWRRAGSSPHTRGAPARRLSVTYATGIIPAYAGSTYGPTGHGRRPSDHPRIRGEHEFALR